jgi:glycosyltransferase involved in cell wall biosynthesis
VTGWRVGVVIPARNEELLLGRCLRSVERALACCGLTAGGAHVVLVADACTDRTAALGARMLAGGGEVLMLEAGSAGRARRCGASRALQHFASAPRERLWLASTDADSAVPPSWIADQLALADRGAAAVAGVVAVDSFAEHPAAVQDRFERRYAGPSDAHPHVHGANLGVRADAYLAAGGWPDLELGEDEVLWRALAEGGWPAVSTRSIAVTTSGRGVGRARGGFADLLIALGDAG